MFDPTFDMNSSVQRVSYWTALKNETGAIIVSANMCPLKELYPPKASDFMISSNLIASLGIKLASLACPHPLGTHDGRFSKLPEMLKYSQTHGCLSCAALSWMMFQSCALRAVRA